MATEAGNNSSRRGERNQNFAASAAKFSYNAEEIIAALTGDAPHSIIHQGSPSSGELPRTVTSSYMAINDPRAYETLPEGNASLMAAIGLNPVVFANETYPNGFRSKVKSVIGSKKIKYNMKMGEPTEEDPTSRLYLTPQRSAHGNAIDVIFGEEGIMLRTQYVPPKDSDANRAHIASPRATLTGFVDACATVMKTLETQYQEKLPALRLHLADTALSDTVIPAIPAEMSKNRCAPQAFDQLGGLTRPKKEMKDIGDLFMNPSLAKRYGLGNRHAMLYGLPGTGKTTLVEALAEYTGANIIPVKITAILDKYVGETPKSIEKVVEDAKAASKKRRTILFFDEIDGLVGRKEDVHDEYGKMISTLLQEIDSITRKENKFKYPNLLLIGATNKSPEDFEASSMRADRFEPISVELPTEEERSEIWQLMLAECSHIQSGTGTLEWNTEWEKSWDPEEINFPTDIARPDVLAKHSAGFAPSDISGVIKAVSMQLFLKELREGEKGIATHDHVMRQLSEYKKIHTDRIAGN